MGRHTADLTSWVEYFLTTVAEVFKSAKEETLSFLHQGKPTVKVIPTTMDPRARAILGHLSIEDRLTAPRAATILGLSDRMTRLLLAAWVREGMLVIQDPSNRKRAYGLSAKYRQFIGNPPPQHQTASNDRQFLPRR